MSNVRPDPGFHKGSGSLKLLAAGMKSQMEGAVGPLFKLVEQVGSKDE